VRGNTQLRSNTPLRSIRMRERAYTFGAHFKSLTGREHRIVLAIVYTVTQPAENKNSCGVSSAAWNFRHGGQSCMREQIRMALKTPLDDNIILSCITNFFVVVAIPWPNREDGRVGDGGEPRPEAVLPSAQHAAVRGRPRRRIPWGATLENVRNPTFKNKY
jgi:hypothetical protein